MGTIEKLEQLEEAATRGKRRRDISDMAAAPIVASEVHVPEDAALIAAMRNALPALIAGVHSLREFVELGLGRR